MTRRLHSRPALVLGLFLVLVSASGAILSLQPVIERAAAVPAPEVTIAQMAAAVAETQPGVQVVTRSPNGVLSAQVRDDAGRRVLTVDPRDGATLPEVAEGQVMRWLKGFHRSLQLGDAGRAAIGGLAAAMAIVTLSGLALLLRSMGGWRGVAGPVRTADAKGWHARLGRAALVGLTLSALTGAWLSAATFGLVPDATEPVLPPASLGTGPAMDLAAMPALDAPLDSLRSLRLPARPGDALTLTTETGVMQIDPASGRVVASATHGLGATVWEWAYRLHTGQGMWAVGLALGLAALMVPALAGTGAVIWWRGRGRRPSAANAPMETAELVILVGSEGGATRGFAETLHRALAAAGFRVHLGEMNAIGPMPRARALMLLAATYGDGVAPASAQHFLARLDRAGRPLPVAVLGFGDRAFPAFCGYASRVGEALAARGWPVLLPMGRIDRQSPAEFAAWGRDLGTALGITLALEHRQALPRQHRLQLISRRDYGETVQAPAAILRFRLRPWWLGGPRFQAGDLLGVMAPGGGAPRFYSLASSSRDGFAEICVRKVPGGACSPWLHGLEPGTRIRAFIRRNPAFRAGTEPLVMIAAGCGIGPMAGLIRGAAPGSETSLYFGLRDPGSDFLYAEELATWQREGRLSRLVTAFSRVDRRHVQHRLREDAAQLRDQIARGARVMVCGSVAMGRAVAAELDAQLAVSGLSVARLKREGRYVEDVY